MADAPGTEGEAESHEEDKDVEPAPTWHDVALSIAAELMDKIRGDVREQLGYTTSAVCLRPFISHISVLVYLSSTYYAGHRSK